MPDGGFDPVRLAPAVERTDYTVKKGDVSLAVYRKRSGAGAAPGAVPRARLVEFGAVVVRPRRARRRVFDDERLRRARLRRVDDGPRELRPLVAHRGQFRHRQRRRRPDRGERAGHRARPGRRKCTCSAKSSGALRAAAFAMERPALVDRLILNAFTYTGRNSPTLAKRAEQLPYFRTHNRRLRDRDDDPQHLHPRPPRHQRPARRRRARRHRAAIRRPGADRHLSRHVRQPAGGRSVARQVPDHADPRRA